MQKPNPRLAPPVVRRQRPPRAEWWDEEAPYPQTPISGQVSYLSNETHDPGFFLPNGEWHAIPRPRMGF